MKEASKAKEDGSKGAAGEVVSSFAFVANYQNPEVVHPGVYPLNPIAALARIKEPGFGATLPTLASAFTLRERGFNTPFSQITT